MFLPERDPGQDWLGVVIAVPEPWATEITNIRVAVGDPLALKVPPHITLMPPLAVNGDQKEAVFEHLGNIASESRPFRLTLGGSETFQPVSPVAFLGVEAGGTQCAQLADDLRSGPLDYRLRFPYLPHVTLAHGLANTELERAMELGRDFHASWMVQGFRVDRVIEDGSYISTAIFDFSAGAA